MIRRSWSADISHGYLSTSDGLCSSFGQCRRQKAGALQVRQTEALQQRHTEEAQQHAEAVQKGHAMWAVLKTHSGAVQEKEAKRDCIGKTGSKGSAQKI